MAVVTIEDFIPTLLQFSHPANLTPAEANRLTLIIVELLSDNVIDSYFLKLLSRFLTREVYSEVIVERNINKLCGYPLCGLTPARSAGVKISSSVSPYAYLGSYCSKDHYQSSEIYKLQLSDEALFARKDITNKDYGMTQYEKGIQLLEEVLAKYENGGSSKDKDHKNDSILEVIRDLNSLKLAENKNDELQDMNKLLQDIKIVEKEPDAPVEGEEGSENDQDEEDDLVDSIKYEYLKDQSRAINGNRLR